MHTENGAVTDILIVEDDPAIIDVLTETLIDEGYHVRTARDGLAGWQAIASVPPALLLTDIRMPVMSGIELVTRVRAAGYTFPIVIIAATEQQAWPLLRLDDTVYIAKPFALTTLLDSVAQYVALEGALLTGA